MGIVPYFSYPYESNEFEFYKTKRYGKTITDYPLTVAVAE